MDVFIHYARELLPKAKMIRDEVRDEQRLKITLSEPPDTWNPGPYSDRDVAKIREVVERLYQIALAVRDHGYDRVTRTGEQPGSSFAVQDLDDAIRAVERLLQQV